MSTRPGDGPQSIEGLLKTINKKWTILTVIAIGNCRRVRFNELRRELSGISPKTLIETLRELEKLGAVTSEQFVDLPPKVEYFLTEDGDQLRKALIPLVRWMASRCEPMNSRVVGNALQIRGK